MANQNDYKKAILSLADANPQLDRKILEHVADLYDPSTGKVSAGSAEMSLDELDSVAGGTSFSQYQGAVLSLGSKFPGLNSGILQQIANTKLHMCW
ncbi:MAG: hypothetical protein HXX08_00710 [Chloroflexi bacterium]|uniref:Uncharacterized protein n=1 Tax=Candidatus Chlorohelix allophototropha TaxID=3003348 RepID=A0A8T7M168_9CHLR|nr:hypothetical protein [Chloroflexota bacterium]WJW66269.1 hypothetical protein OZ401_002061 [Chloroflexota bacterium L227-S17]